MENESNKSSGYGKRPLWQWVLIYIVIGGIIYFAIYYLFLRGKYSSSNYSNSGSSYSSPSATPTQMPTSMPQDTTAPTNPTNQNTQPNTPGY